MNIKKIKVCLDVWFPSGLSLQRPNITSHIMSASVSVFTGVWSALPDRDSRRRHRHTGTDGPQTSWYIHLSLSYLNCDRVSVCSVCTQPPLSICYHGSRLVQALAKFKDRSILMNSLHALSSADLRTLGTDSAGSHALQALVTSASDKGRGKFLRKLEVKHVPMPQRS